MPIVTIAVFLKWWLIVVLFSIFLMADDVEYFFHVLLGHFFTFLQECLFDPLPTVFCYLCSFFFFFFLAVLGLELRTFTLSHSTSPFLWKVFQDRVSWKYLPRPASNRYPPDLSSWVARIIGMSHWCLTSLCSYRWIERVLNIFWILDLHQIYYL
jgi:hypothetical protein